MKLSYYTSKTVLDLEKDIASNLEWYYGANAPLPNILPVDGVRKSKVDYLDFASSLVTDAHNPPETDAKNALVVYKSLKNLTPHQASIDRLWVYLCHKVARDYIIYRWFSTRIGDKKKEIKNVRNHYFVSGDRSLIRDNAISRLWWLGKIAFDIDQENPDKFLEILLHRQDVRSALIERPSVSRNRDVLKVIYAIMKEHWENNTKLFDRKIFRLWMTSLNRLGGVILLDSFDEKQLLKLLKIEAENALKKYE